MYVGDVRISKGTKAHELLSSGDPKDAAKAKKLVAYCEECRAANYRYEDMQRLREKYKEVV